MASPTTRTRTRRAEQGSLPTWIKPELAALVKAARRAYVLFEDPDGIRLEVNYVPGAGLLADRAQFNPGISFV